MNLEFLIVGVAKNNNEDFRQLFNETKSEVFGLALAIVKDTSLATDILVETYKRAGTLAYLFNTELSAEYWLLDMAKNIANNALHDPKSAAYFSPSGQSSLSRPLIELINNSKNDRAAIVFLRTLSHLNRKDIARLLWYKTGSANNEYKRGIARLAECINKQKKDIPAIIRRDIESITPDVFGRVIDSGTSRLSHISHEELSLSDDDLVYTAEDTEKALEEKHRKERKRKKRLIILAIIISIIVIANIIVLLFTNIIKNDKEQSENVDLQRGNKTSVVEVNGTIYFRDNKDNDYLYKYKDGKAELLMSESVIEMVTDGQSLYVRDNDAKIHVIDPETGDDTLLTETSASSLAYYEGKIYFYTGKAINSINTDGSDEQEYVSLDQESDEIKILIAEGYTPYCYLMKFSPSGKLYFSGGSGTGIYTVEDFGEEIGIDPLYPDEIYTFEVTDSCLYYDYKEYDDDGNATIYIKKFDFEANTVERVPGYTLGTGAYILIGDTFYFDGYVDGKAGIYAGNIDGTGEYTLLSDLRASDMFCFDGNLYIYYPGTDSSPGKYLKQINIQSLNVNGVF